MDQQPVLACLVIGRRAVVAAAVVQADERPVVVAVAFGALAAGDLLPRPGRDAPEQGVGTVSGAACPDRVVAGTASTWPTPRASRVARSPGVGAVDLIAGHPRRRDPGVQRAAEHPGGQLRLGGELDLLGDAGRSAALGIIDPALGQVHPPPVDQGVAGAAGIPR